MESSVVLVPQIFVNKSAALVSPIDETMVEGNAQNKLKNQNQCHSPF